MTLDPTSQALAMLQAHVYQETIQPPRRHLVNKFLAALAFSDDQIDDEPMPYRANAVTLLVSNEDQQPLILVDVRSPAAALVERDQAALAQHAADKNVPFVAHTDGDTWQFRKFQNGDPDPLTFLDLQLSTKLIQHLVPIANDLIRLFHQPDADPIFETEEVWPRWVALDAYEPPDGTPPPRAVRFAGNEAACDLKTWKDLLILTVTRLWKDSHLQAADLPITTSKKRHLVHSRAEHPNGAPFTNPERIDGPQGTLWLENQSSSLMVRRTCRHLLEEHGAGLLAELHVDRPNEAERRRRNRAQPDAAEPPAQEEPAAPANDDLQATADPEPAELFQPAQDSAPSDPTSA